MLCFQLVALTISGEILMPVNAGLKYEMNTKMLLENPYFLYVHCLHLQ